MKKYNKLVRDKIPNIIKANGGECKFHVAKKDEYIDVLNEKILEEVQEFIENPCAEEIADVLEVIEAIARMHRINLDDIKSVKKKKREERGSFNLMFVLDEATEFKLRKGDEVIKPGYINSEATEPKLKRDGSHVHINAGQKKLRKDFKTSGT